MEMIDFQMATRVLFGPGRLAGLGELAREFGARRALVVSDEGVIHAGHARRGLDALEAAGVETRLFSGVHENPTDEHVESGRQLAAEFQPELIVGLGGGSSMDCAKGINFVHAGGGRMQDYWGLNKAQGKLLPLIAVPTTAGTGSETQSFALISDAKTHVKMACGDRRAAARVALIDPLTTLTQPVSVTALTGYDALSHAVETWVTRRRHALSLVFSREAFRLLATNYLRVLAEPNHVEARGGMQLGACIAGMAIENSMLGATHALANPLTAKFDIPHGQAIAVMLPHVVRFNGEDAQVFEWYCELLAAVAAVPDAPSPSEGSIGLSEFLTRLAQRGGLKTTLHELGVPADALYELAVEAAKQWTGTFNPRPVGEAELLALYNAALGAS
ncbi:MAG: iron-containing alcohol dehydrogenase [Pirellulales bacterium]|nr:iron-containing alcohol dehydrogenase [Pirellulales bacterium]